MSPRKGPRVSLGTHQHSDVCYVPREVRDDKNLAVTQSQDLEREAVFYSEISKEILRSNVCAVGRASRA